MRTIQIGEIEYTNESDYLSASKDLEIEHLLIDIQDKKIIDHKKMNVSEKEKRNTDARRVGELTLVWCPALFTILPRIKGEELRD